MAAPDEPSHTPFRVVKHGWTLYVSHARATRLVVFVHGFRGQAVGTWRLFPDSGVRRDWWRTVDMLFVGYDSQRHTITGVAHSLRGAMPEYYPLPLPEAMSVGDVHPRKEFEAPYDELIMLGHSLGGLIVRRALSDAAERWKQEHKGLPEHRPALLDAQVRLFSPASAGFRAAGLLGMIRATPVWAALEMYLRRSSAFSDLQPGSEILVATQRRTEQWATQDGCQALRARLVWAQPEDVVVPERYHTDFVDDAWGGTTHSSVCKPTPDFERPWVFAETGQS